MNVARLRAGLTTCRFGRSLVYESVVDSTNARAAGALRNGIVSDGAVFVADRQTKGRGTRGRVWHSSDPDGLWMSIVLHQPLPVQPLSFLPGLAIVDLVQHDYGVEPLLKWPNDVLVEGRKLSGALIESERTVDGRTAWIVGIGLNVNQTSFAAPITDVAVSLRMITGQPSPLDVVCCRLLQRLESLYQSGDDLVELWRTRSRLIGRRIDVRTGSRSFSVTAHDLTPEGHLIVVHDDGVSETWVATSNMELSVRA